MGAWTDVRTPTKADPTPEFVALDDAELAGLERDGQLVIFHGARYDLKGRDAYRKATLAQREP